MDPILLILIIQTAIFGLTLGALVWQVHTMNRHLQDNVYMDIVSKADVIYERLLQAPSVLGPLVFPHAKMAAGEDAKDCYLKKGFMLSFLNLFHWVFLQKARGNVPLDSWQRWYSLMASFVAQPEMLAFWDGLDVRDERFASGFVQTVSRIIERQRCGTTAADDVSNKT